MAGIVDRGTISITDIEQTLVPGLIQGATLRADADGRLQVVANGSVVTLSKVAPELERIVRQLPGNYRTMAALVDDLAAGGGPLDVPMLYAQIARLASQGVLAHSVVDAHGCKVASIIPATVSYRFLVRPLPPSESIRLSRFCVMHRDGDSFKLVSPRGSAVLRVHQAAAIGVIGLMMEPRSVDELYDQALDFGVEREVTAGILTLLWNAGLLDFCPADGPEAAESTDELLWNVHDLMFHVSSRFGFADGPFGGNFRHIGAIEPDPVLRPLPGSVRIPLPVPVLEELLVSDPPLQDVVESRRSIYTYGEAPITIDDLGEFLYRTARVRWMGELEVQSTATGETAKMGVSSRPYPAGGRGYELELYLTVGQCDGVESGLYHYDPAGHQLSLVRSPDFLTEHLIAYAGLASPGVRPQVVVTMAARFRRMMWKYDRLAYAAILKHVGVMMHQMYLAATAMNLAPSAQGSGNSAIFAAAAGNDPLIEGAVGEFILGSSPVAGSRRRPTMLYLAKGGDEA